MLQFVGRCCDRDSVVGDERVQVQLGVLELAPDFTVEELTHGLGVAQAAEAVVWHLVVGVGTAGFEADVKPTF